MASKLAPDFKETLAKFATDTGIKPEMVFGENAESLESKVRAYAKGMATTNLDVAAWLYVKAENKVPPPMKVSAAPFTIIEKPYIPLVEAQIKTLGEQVGFNVRGYVLSKRGWMVRSSGKPATALLITDMTDLRELVYFGDQVDKIDQLLPLGFPKGQAIKVTNVQCKYQKQDPTKWGLSISGYYSDTSKIGDTELDLPGRTAIGLMKATRLAKDVKQNEVAMIRVRALSADNKPYVGCPSCKKKISDNTPAGRSTICPSDKSSCSGSQVTATSIDRFRVTAFDDSGEVKLSFGFGESFVPFAKLQEFATQRLALMVAGQLNDSGEFDVSYIAPAGEATTTVSAPVQVTVSSTAVTGGTTTQTVQIVSTPPIATTTLTAPKTAVVAPFDAALRSLRVIGPLPKTEFIQGFLVGKKGMSLEDAQAVVIELLEQNKAVLDGDQLRIA